MTREERLRGQGEALPDRVIVDQHGHYWRDFGAFLSMCPVSDENSRTEVAAVYVRAVRRESRDGSGPARYVAADLDPDRDGAPFPAGVNRPDYQPFDADDLRSIVLALEAIPTWFPETLAKARAMSQPDGEVITDAHGDELEHGGPGDFPGQFPDRTETPRETAAREKREANP